MNFITRANARLQTIYFKSRLFINGILGLPAQTGKEIRIFRATFDSFINGEKITIFEWGSGFSSIYYSEYLRKKGIKFQWHSIDNNKIWYENIRTKLKKKNLQGDVQIYLKEFLSFWEKPQWGRIPPACGEFGPKSENENAYINFPKLLNKRFDIIIIDARFRRHCIQTAKKVLSPRGIVILHDAQKSHYHAGLEDFPYSKFIFSGSWYPFQKEPNRIWIGSIENNKVFDVLKQL